jgi:hypothetical protein
MENTRREFIYWLSLMATLPPEGLLASPSGETSKKAAQFETAERELLGDLCEQIFPQDEFPGARELGAVHFLENILTQAHPEWWAVYHKGLRAVDHSSRILHNRGFHQLAFAEQTRLMQQMEKGILPAEAWKEIQPAPFFSMIRDHTTQAVFSHPKYGGNKDRAAWNMIGYDDWWVEK